MLNAMGEIRARKLPAVFGLWVLALSCGMVLIGLLIIRLLPHTWPLSAEDGVDRFFAAHRVGWANTATDALSILAGTLGASAVTLLAVAWARWRFGGWRESAYLAFSVLLELTVFLVTTFLVHRPRPSVAELDASPPTSSFPSGHTAAAVALYGAIALLGYAHTRRRACWILLLIPAAVGAARLYRGMHHPSDVAAGVLLGALCVWAAWRGTGVGVPHAGQGERPHALAADRLGRVGRVRSAR